MGKCDGVDGELRSQVASRIMAQSDEHADGLIQKMADGGAYCTPRLRN